LNLYEGMFLLDNNVVREDWNTAKGAAIGILEKHDAKIATARRWAERSLAYTIKKRNRGTYLLVHFEADPGSIAIVRRDLELSETVMRYLVLTAGEVPEGEKELHEAELSSDFSVPEPPEDHVVDMDEEEEGDVPRDGSSSESSEGQPAKAEATSAEAEAPAAEEAESTEAEAPAAEEAESTEAEAPAAEEAESTEAEAPAAEEAESTEAEAPAAEEAESTEAEAPAAEEAESTEAEEPAAEEAESTEAEEPAAEEGESAEPEAPAVEATESDEEQTEEKSSEEG